MKPTSRLNAVIVGIVFAAVTLAVSAQVDLRPSLGTLWFASAGYVPAGVISSNVTPVSNGTTVETDLMTYALPGGALSANGKGVRVTAWGSLAATANTKTIKLYFGSTAISTLASAVNNGNWQVTYVVLRTSATAQIAEGRIEFNNAAGQVAATANLLATPAETLSGAVTIKVTGQSNAASTDVTQLAQVIEALP